MSTRSRGAALLAALLLVALATAIAYAITFDTGLTLRRAAGASDQDQAQLLAGGVEAFAADVLVRDRPSGTTQLSQNWAQPLGPLEISGDEVVTAAMDDLQGRFNLNALVDAQGKIDPFAVSVFENLLRNVGLETRWAAAIADWIDVDDQAYDQNGAEDALYTTLTPAYRAANRALVSPSELLALHDFGIERYARIAPYVTALPRSVPINLCTAAGPLLDALTGEEQWTRAPDALRKNRERNCFPTKETFRLQFADATRHTRIVGSFGVAERSDWFALRTLAAVGSTEFSLYSLLHLEDRPEGAQARVLTRRFAE